MKTKEAEDICGGLSKPSKMPSFSYNLPATSCPTGSRMRRIEGSVCNKCYACKGRYMFPAVQKALHKRLDSLELIGWVDSMVHLIGTKCAEVPYFRFHDSGDIQGHRHLDKIIRVAFMLPHIKFWLPTLETKMINDYFVEGDMLVPLNLNIRISTPMINGVPNDMVKSMVKTMDGITYSTVVSDEKYCKVKNICPAIRFKTGNCGACRRCWDRNFTEVVYLKH